MKTHLLYITFLSVNYNVKDPLSSKVFFLTSTTYWLPVIYYNVVPQTLVDWTLLDNFELKYLLREIKLLLSLVLVLETYAPFIHLNLLNSILN